jgi:hypothetical protein
VAVAGAYWALGIVSFPGSAWERWTEEAVTSELRTPPPMKTWPAARAPVGLKPNYKPFQVRASPRWQDPAGKGTAARAARPHEWPFPAGAGHEKS